MKTTIAILAVAVSFALANSGNSIGIGMGAGQKVMFEHSQITPEQSERACIAQLEKEDFYPKFSQEDKAQALKSCLKYLHVNVHAKKKQ